MDITITREGVHLIVGVEGRVDGSNAADLQAAIEVATLPSDQAVIVDMGGVQFIASTGLRILLMIRRGLQKQNAKLVSCSLQGPAREAFTASGFDKVVPFYNSREDALRALTE